MICAIFRDLEAASFFIGTCVNSSIKVKLAWNERKIKYAYYSERTPWPQGSRDGQ